VTQAATRSRVTVREVRGIEELRACQELQRKAWGITEDGYVVPVATMAAAQRVGGLILGAFDENLLLVGFAFAFLGKLEGRMVLWSQLTGVHPAHQSTGVGRLLKFEQRRRAREMDLEAIAWAFDPMQAVNAAFNMSVLGATARLYEVDMYGSRSDALNSGLATDRLIAEWETQGDPGGLSNAWPDTVDVLNVESGRVTGVNRIPTDAAHVSIEVPARVTDLKNMGSSAAIDWQQGVRQAFQVTFDAGFVVRGFSRADAQRPRYLLESSR
jgi:predicted GNAT superfamily acetyltransferase